MIHELDLLDIASYVIKPNESFDLTFKSLIRIKKKIENQFASIEVDIDDNSINRFQHRYSDFVKIDDTRIRIHMTTLEYTEITKLRTPYLETEIIRLLKDEKL